MTPDMDELSQLFRGQSYLRDGSLNIFRLGGERLLDRKGVLAGGTQWPSIAEATEYFKGLRFGPKSRNAGFIESLLNRMLPLGGFLSETIAVSSSDQLAKLARQPVIFRFHDLVGTPLQFLVGYLLTWLMRFREGVTNAKPHLVILEEPHMLIADKSRQDIGEGFLLRVFRTARKRGIGLMLCDQVPSQLPSAILGNLGCRVVMRLTNAQCKWSMQQSMGLNRLQADAISRLPSRRAIVHYALRPDPFEIEIPEIGLPLRPSESQVQQWSGVALEDIRWTLGKPEMNKARTSAILSPGELTGDILQVMIRICESPAELIESRCEALRMDRAREGRARDELRDRGLICQAERKIGGKNKLFLPTDKGKQWAVKRKIRVKQFKSGIVHEYLLSEVERRIGHTCHRWRLQRNSSIAQDQGLQPDLLVMVPSGRRIVIEVCCTNIEYDATNIGIEAGILDIDQVVAVTPDKKTKKSLQEAISESWGAASDLLGSIDVYDAGECLGDDFDWRQHLVLD